VVPPEARSSPWRGPSANIPICGAAQFRQTFMRSDRQYKNCLDDFARRIPSVWGQCHAAGESREV
jgi:hypothetical protein